MRAGKKGEAQHLESSGNQGLETIPLGSESSQPNPFRSSVFPRYSTTPRGCSSHRVDEARDLGGVLHCYGICKETFQDGITQPILKTSVYRCGIDSKAERIAEVPHDDVVVLTMVWWYARIDERGVQIQVARRGPDRNGGIDVGTRADVHRPLLPYPAHQTLMAPSTARPGSHGTKLFRRHVRQSTAEPTLRMARAKGQIEVQEHRLAARCHQDVGGLQV